MSSNPLPTLPRDAQVPPGVNGMGRSSRKEVQILPSPLPTGQALFRNSIGPSLVAAPRPSSTSSTPRILTHRLCWALVGSWCQPQGQGKVVQPIPSSVSVPGTWLQVWMPSAKSAREEVPQHRGGGRCILRVGLKLLPSSLH